MSLTVLNPGMLATVQDLGRPGFASAGVSISGAADPLSLILGNRMVGNQDGRAQVELTLVGGVFRIESTVRVVLAGADAGRASTTTRRGSTRLVRTMEVFECEAGEVLRVGPITGGARVYLCVGGGIEAPAVLGSRSTQVMLGDQSVGPPLLRAGDVLAIGMMSGAPRGLSERVRSVWMEAVGRRVLRVVDGPDTDAAARLEGGPWRVLPAWDRRAIRVAGPRVMSGDDAGRRPTHPMAAGFVQATPSGELLVLGPDGPTTGGYPVPLAVASVDLASLGQVRPGDEVGFERIEVAEGRRLLAERVRTIDEELPPERSPA